MAYTRYNESNVAENPQPGSTTVNHFSGNEGWATRTIKNWNTDYQARKSDNSTRTPAANQRRNSSNTSVSA